MAIRDGDFAAVREELWTVQGQLNALKTGVGEALGRTPQEAMALSPLDVVGLVEALYRDRGRCAAERDAARAELKAARDALADKAMGDLLGTLDAGRDARLFELVKAAVSGFCTGETELTYEGMGQGAVRVADAAMAALERPVNGQAGLDGSSTSDDLAVVRMTLLDAQAEMALGIHGDTSKAHLIVRKAIAQCDRALAKRLRGGQ